MFRKCYSPIIPQEMMFNLRCSRPPGVDFRNAADLHYLRKICGASVHKTISELGYSGPHAKSWNAACPQSVGDVHIICVH